MCFDRYFIPGSVAAGADVTIFVVIIYSVATPKNGDTATFIRVQNVCGSLSFNEAGGGACIKPDMQNVLMTVMHHASASSFTSHYAPRNRREHLHLRFILLLMFSTETLLVVMII